MIGLKGEVIEQIRSLLALGKCDEVRKILRDIAERYSGLDTYFVPRYELRDHIDYPPNPALLATVAKCLDEAVFEIRVEAEPYIRDGFDEDFTDWSAYPFFDSDIEMRVEGLTPDQLEHAIKKINGLDSLCWVADADKTLTADEFMEILETNESRTDCSYVVMLEPVEGRRLSLVAVEAGFYGRIGFNNVVIHVKSSINTYKRYQGLWGSERDRAILDTIKRLWRDFRILNPKIVFILKPSI